MKQRKSDRTYVVPLQHSADKQNNISVDNFSCCQIVSPHHLMKLMKAYLKLVNGEIGQGASNRANTIRYWSIKVF